MYTFSSALLELFFEHFEFPAFCLIGCCQKISKASRVDITKSNCNQFFFKLAQRFSIVNKRWQKLVSLPSLFVFRTKCGCQRSDKKNWILKSYYSNSRLKAHQQNRFFICFADIKLHMRIFRSRARQNNCLQTKQIRPNWSDNYVRSRKSNKLEDF